MTPPERGGDAVVTGLGAVSAAGPGTGALLRAWRSGERCIRPVRRFDVAALPCGVGGEMPDPGTPAASGLRGEAHLRDAVEEALRCAALPAGSRVRLVLSTTKGLLASGDEVARGAATLDPALATRRLAALLRAEGFPVAGPGGVGDGALVSVACAGGTAAAGVALAAAEELRRGDADAVLCAGIDLLSDFVFRGFAALQAMDPAPCRPFDRGRAGMSASEGAAAILLETRDAARRRGARVRGRLLGFGLAADGTHRTAPRRDGAGLAAAVTGALAMAGVAPEALGHVHAHGTATPFNDAMEVAALRAALGPAAARVPATTLKGTVGHAFGAAGLLELVASLLALESGAVPPIAGLADPEPDLLLPREPFRPVSPLFLKVGAGFGGFNAALVAEGVLP